MYDLRSCKIKKNTNIKRTNLSEIVTKINAAGLMPQPWRYYFI